MTAAPSPKRRPRRRNVSLYCVVIGPDLVIMRMPERLVAWTVIRKAANASLRLHHGTLAKDVRAYEGMADDPSTDEDGGKCLLLLEAAFAGSTTTFSKFSLHAWNEETRSFDLVRRGAK
jgi:hypothetical protein